MSTYSQPIWTAVIFFMAIAAIMFLPWMIYTYRKYGFLSLSKTIIVFSFILYFLAALFLVLLPLPATRDVCSTLKPNAQFMSLQPFQFIFDIVKDSAVIVTQPSTWVYVVKQPAFYQAFFNFLLLAPLGVYLRYYLKVRRKWGVAYLCGLGVSLFYEVTQVTGIFGLYNCPYRIFDIDDLMLNSVGCLVGFLLAPIILALFPKHEDVVSKSKLLAENNIVRPLHRLLAFVVDISILNTVARFFTDSNGSVNFLTQSFFYVIGFAVLPFLTKGATVGMLLLKLRMSDAKTGKASLRMVARHFIVVYCLYLWFKAPSLLNVIEFQLDSPFYVLRVWLAIASFGLAFGSTIVVFIHVVDVILHKGEKMYFFDRAARIKVNREL